jgi:hypothetical protein
VPLVEFAFEARRTRKHANMSPGITPGQRASPTNAAQRLLLCPLLFLFAAWGTTAALGKGGTNMYDLRDAQARPPSPANEGLGGCGRVRCRDRRTQKCRGPADFGN